MFESTRQDVVRNHATQYTSLVTSILVHSALASALVCSQLILFEGIPGRELATLLTHLPESFDSPKPLSPPSMPAGNRESHVPEAETAYHTHVPKDEMEMPSKIPSFIPPPTDDPVFLRTASNVEGIPGVRGGVGTAFVPGEGSGLLLDYASLPALKTPEPPSRAKIPLRIGVLNPSRLIFRVSPKYPVLAHKMGISGPVLLEALIDEEGTVSKVDVIEGHPLLRDSAVDAVKQWKYSPTVQNGEPIAVIATIKIIYKIDR